MSTRSDKSARDHILGAIREGLAAGDQMLREEPAMIDARLRGHARNLLPARTNVSAPELVDLFESQAKSVQATVRRVANMATVPAEIADFLKGENLPARLVMAPDDTLDEAPWTDAPMLEIRRDKPNIDDAVGVTSAMAAVAETGTLVAVSGPEHPATLNFVPETHIVVLPIDRITATYEDAWDRIRAAAAENGGSLPRTVNFITGPSRSGDIEQTLLLGAHGPRRLHIILVDNARVDHGQAQG